MEGVPGGYRALQDAEVRFGSILGARGADPLSTSKNRPKSSPRWVWAPAHVGLRIVNYLLVMVTQIRIHPEAEIGPGLLMPHVGPIRVIEHTKIGADCVILHTCTIGAGPNPGVPTIGDHVFVGCHASIVGAVTVGDRATISANSLVISNVPPGATALGVPARILTGWSGTGVKSS